MSVTVDLRKIIDPLRNIAELVCNIIAVGRFSQRCVLGKSRVREKGLRRVREADSLQTTWLPTSHTRMLFHITTCTLFNIVHARLLLLSARCTDC